MGSLHTQQPNLAAKYVLKHAETKEEMSGIMDAIWAANYTPYEPFAQLFFPVLGFQPADWDAALAESRERFWNMHLEDPSSNWLYIQDVASNTIVGCAQWQIFKENPFPDGPPKLQAPWWPEGEYREFCELILNQVYKPRASWMVRPHLGKYIIWPYACGFPATCLLGVDKHLHELFLGEFEIK